MRDVIVVGAGPAGSATAAYLARGGLDVLFVDKHAFPRDKTCGDAISPRAVHVLEDLNMMDRVRTVARRIEAMGATGPKGATLLTAIPPEPPFPKTAYVIRRYDLDDIIRRGAVDAGAEFAGEMHVRGLEEKKGHYLLGAESRAEEIELKARVVVLAVGASVPLLRSAGLLPHQLDIALAARAYYRGLPPLDRAIQVRFDGVPLPGYGWLFPLAESVANIGAGFYRRTSKTPRTAAATLHRFLEHPPMQRLLADAEQISPVKGYPLRTDFHRSPTFGPRLLLTGEACGLVNPFTGEGIDYALESGQLAAQTILHCFKEGEFGRSALARYDHALRARFQQVFVLTHLLRRIYMNQLILEPLLRAARSWPDLAVRLVRIFLAYDSPRTALSPTVALRVLRSFR